MAATKKALLEKILVPLDGSELADRILSQVKRLLVRQDGEVMLVRVLSRGALDREPGPGQELDVARRHLDGVVAALRAQGATVGSEVLVGEPAERIHSFALAYEPSLVAMSTHGRTGLSRWVRGSVAERVLRVARYPLLLANPFGLVDRQELRFQRILVPLDGSESSAQILPLVKELAALYESEVILHTTVEIPQVEPLFSPLMVSTEDAQKLLEPHGKQFPGTRVRISTSLGSPAATILEVAEREKADLVAMTTHGRTGASRWAFGSVAEQVVRHCPCPLLVKRMGGFERQATE